MEFFNKTLSDYHTFGKKQMNEKAFGIKKHTQVFKNHVEQMKSPMLER
jgi:hypothetical protein